MGSNTTTSSGHTVLMIPHDTWDENWSCVADLGWEIMRIHSIIFKGATANDALIVRNGAADGPEIINWKIGGDTEEQVFYGYGAEFTPYITAAECVDGGTNEVRIIINFV